MSSFWSPPSSSALTRQCGPFVDIEHSAFNDTSAENLPDPVGLFDNAFNGIVRAALGDTSTKLVLVPSLLDFNAHIAFPQPPFSRQILETEIKSKLSPEPTLLSNPSSFCLNELIVGVCNADVVMNLSAVEIAKSSSSRLAR
jgi:hypothetical protein